MSRRWPAMPRMTFVLSVSVVASLAVAVPARAATGVTAVAIPVTAAAIGPDSGLLKPGDSFYGVTPVLGVTLPSEAERPARLTVVLEGADLLVPLDLQRGDGLSVYQDIGNQGFDIADFEEGPVSTGFATTPRDDAGRTSATLSFSGITSTASARYIVTVRPSYVVRPDRTFTVAIPAGGIVTNSNNTGPATTVTTGMITLDSTPPSALVADMFTVEQAEPGKEDAAVLADPAALGANSVAFLNDVRDVGVDNLLISAAGAPVLAPAGQTGRIAIGDGSGITASNPIARNNQRSDKVYVRAVDAAENFSDPLVIVNDVTAPRIDSGTIAIENASAINTANEASVVLVTTTSGSIGASEQRARLTSADPETSQTVAATDWVSAKFNAALKHAPLDSTLLGSDFHDYLAEIVNVDAAGNASDPLRSQKYAKDTTVPTVLSISPSAQAVPGNSLPGDEYRVYFSEPIRPDAIAASTQGVPSTAPNTVAKVLRISGPGAPPSWGTSPGWRWDADNLAGTLTLDVAPISTRLPLTGDQVEIANVPDTAGNAITARTAVQTSGLRIKDAVTLDLLGPSRFGQAHDGIVDSIDVEFTGNIDASSVGSSASSFLITWRGAVIPSAATAIAATKVRLEFDAKWGTDAKPVVAVGWNAPPSLRGAAGVAVVGSSFRGRDGAAPAIRSVTTRYTTANGKLDTLVVTYSERIDHSAETPRGYVVAGYETNSVTTVGAWNTFTPTSGYGTETRVSLAEKQSGFDTEALPQVNFRAAVGTNVDGIRDEAGNTLTSWLTTITDTAIDGAPPLLVDRATFDFDADGVLDGVSIQSTEALLRASLRTAQFSVAERSVSGVIPVDGREFWLLFAGRNADTGPQGDTDDMPLVEYIGGREGGITDGANVALPIDTAPVPARDTAGPAIIAASSMPHDGDEVRRRVAVAMSETLDTSTVDADDFAILQGVNRHVSTEAVAGADGRSVIATFSSAYDFGQPATVVLNNDGGITDSAVPPNESLYGLGSLVAPIPSASLTVAGPAGSTAGHSTSRTVAVAAGGNELAKAWLLRADSSTTPAKDDPGFTDAPPTQFTFASDGAHVLRLWTRDSLGMVSAPAVASIVVDTVAPVIASLTAEFTDPAGREGARVNDEVRLVVSATGQDAETWAADGARADLTRLAGPAGSALRPVTFAKVGTGSRLIEFPFRSVTAVTEQYPAGTVIRLAGTTAPYFVVAQDAQGRQFRRPAGGAVLASFAVQGRDVVSVPRAVLDALPVGVALRPRDGSLVRALGGGTVYVVKAGRRHPLGAAAYKALRYSPKSIIALPASDLGAMPVAGSVSPYRHAPGTFIRVADGRVFRVTSVAGGDVLRPVKSRIALATLVRGVDVVPAVAADVRLRVDTLVVGARDGVVFRDKHSGRPFIVSRGARRFFKTEAIAVRLRYAVSSAVSASGWDLTYRIGMTRLDGPPVATRTVPAAVRVSDAAGNSAERAALVSVLGSPDPGVTAGFTTS